MFNIFGFYKFKKINFLNKNKKILQSFLIKNNVRGTVIISPEGINGTISGKPKDIIKSKKKLKAYLKIIILIVKIIQKINFTLFTEQK